MKRVSKIVMVATILIVSNVTNGYANVHTFNNLDDVEQSIYEHLENRDNTFSFSYTGNKDEFKNNIAEVISKAINKDDYTERSWLEIKPKAEISNSRIDTNINVIYLTTKEQEDYVENELKKILSQLIKPNMTDSEKVRIISDYIINRYDYDDTLKSNNAYTALTTGKTICQGYSMTVYKMLTYVGIKNRIIVGKINTLSHSWNYVKLEGKWYHLDVTNDDSTRSNKYFLVQDNVLEENNYIWNKENYK